MQPHLPTNTSQHGVFASLSVCVCVCVCACACACACVCVYVYSLCVKICGCTSVTNEKVMSEAAAQSVV